MRYKTLATLILSTAVVVSLLAGAPPVTVAAAQTPSLACVEEHTVQADDLLSAIADRFYGDLFAYTAIVEATNAAAQRDDKYASIADADVIEVGQVLCIPGEEDALAMLGEQPQAPAPAPTPAAPAQPVVTQSAATGSIRFSQESRVARQPFQLTMASQVGGTIHYTTNGSLPSTQSPRYGGPISINESTVVRAQVFSADGTPVGDVQTRSYLIADYDQTIPVVSIVADWGDLNTLHEFAAERGKDWERPINIEYFEPGGRIGFNVKAGIRIHGNFSRLFSPKKSYRIYFRKEYGGPGNLDYPLFEDTSVTKFDKLVLRAGFQDSFLHRNIPDRADRHEQAKFISDQVVRNLHRDMGQPIAHGDWVLLYLNGEFWGLYNLTERIDLQFIRSYSDKDSDWDIIVKESGWEEGVWYNREEVRDGGYGVWLENQNWVGSADFSNPGNIGVLEWRVDMENVFSYMFLQAYVQNTDWPGANWVVYRRNDPGAVGNEAQWRMMVWDAEEAFGTTGGGFKLDLNTVERVHSPHDSITRILEKPFLSNCALKHQFVNRAREYLGVENLNGRPASEVGQLAKDRVIAEITRQAAVVRPFIQMESTRWAPDLPGLAIFDRNVENMLRFTGQREEVVLHHLDILRYQTFTDCQ
ncbi:MAG: CotH kinase family protein [Anaerolineae bacterium]